MTIPKISILIANYNNGHFFKDCYDCLINQTEIDWEAIILDDCSTDDSFKIIKEIIKDDRRFFLYSNEINLGVGFTKGKLVTLAKGNICGFLDPDDSLTDNALEVMLNKHKENPNASIINSNLVFCDQNLNPINSTKIKQIKNKDKNFFNLQYMICHFATFKKNFYELTSGIDPFFKIAEDQDLYLKLYEVGDSIQISNKLYLYRKNPNSLTNTTKQDQKIFWQWLAILKAAERRNIIVDELFFMSFTTTDKIKKIYNSKWVKLGLALGFLKHKL